MILAPSVLSLDYADFNNSIEILNNKCEWLHFDVMDGHFVPNLTFGPDILKAFRKSTSLFLDVHLMVSDPKFFVEPFAKAGADGITFHLEALDFDEEKIIDTINFIHSKYLKAGISIKPGTDIEKLYPYLKYVDLVLVMSVKPGFGGQKFMSDQLEKVKQLKALKVIDKYDYIIEIDGGVNIDNIKEIVDAGAEAVVAGSAVFKEDIEDNINRLVHASK